MADLLVRDFDLRTLAEVRHEVERFCGRWNLDGLALYRFVVAVNEITTNAVRHGGGSGRLLLWYAGHRLHCRVTDRGPGMPEQLADRPAPPESPSGRGLWLARHNVGRFTVHSDADGTTITLEHQVMPVV
ncbi:Anti-sigma regulatory factor (Ser/Thr protein kinase) [Nonomuraea solani]|uniref:Anti-sigma regulatory factor (Ser/Thr protein kinase) n=1 Tax=Nonomuraea solani TaxID=1144553 RepID=A0A1H6DU48_9ACTN|nr:ATP-binding protein [Nonomuraea solani]SEG88877.1 Anti-sigma regulatory factor (Ser/Thr protein kinase) [Nonomuraea solani]